VDEAPGGGTLYPAGLVVRGRRCLVVGAGQVAARKIAGLLRCGAAVTVVAPEAHVALGILAAEGLLASIEGEPMRLELRPYRRGEVGDYRLVVTATGDPGVDQTVSEDAEAAGVWVNSADDPGHCSFMLPAVHRCGSVTVAVATDGASPALARWVRDRVAASLDPSLGALAALLGEARAAVHERGGSTEDVDWEALLGGELPALVASGRTEEARARLAEAVGAALPPS
jgi:precorrin-2 dehydrogenase/sirohydrochlorin ferrochelatase